MQVKATVHYFYTLGTLGAGGVTYTRWGSSSCSNSTGAQLVYNGSAAGTWFSNSGGGAEKICLPNDPDYLSGTTGLPSTESNIYGAEYEFGLGPQAIRSVWPYTAPCAVCHVPNRAAAIMVPAKSSCPPSWSMEYYGYLTTESDHHHRSSFNCVDVNPEVVPGTGADSNGALFYFVSSTCTGIACPPYENGRILSCAVCTK